MRGGAKRHYAVAVTREWTSKTIVADGQMPIYGYCPFWTPPIAGEFPAELIHRGVWEQLSRRWLCHSSRYLACAQGSRVPLVIHEYAAPQAPAVSLPRLMRVRFVKLFWSILKDGMKCSNSPISTIPVALLLLTKNI